MRFYEPENGVRGGWGRVKVTRVVCPKQDKGFQIGHSYDPNGKGSRFTREISYALSLEDKSLDHLFTVSSPVDCRHKRHSSLIVNYTRMTCSSGGGCRYLL